MEIIVERSLIRFSHKKGPVVRVPSVTLLFSSRIIILTTTRGALVLILCSWYLIALPFGMVFSCV